MTGSHVDGGVRADVRARLPASPLSGDDARWLGWPLLVGLAVVALYLATNDYPAYGAGLYVETADAIRANGYALPATVPHYGPEGVPFAYPPLMFYVLALLRDVGAGAFATSLYLPPLFTLAALVPTYLLGRDVVGDRRAGTAAALLLVLNPQVLEWHISAGGLVRAPAFVFALWGSYAGLRIFRDGAREWVLPGLAAVALVAHTHPTYTIFTVATYLLFWVGYDRSPTGFLRGAVVGFGALALALPWLGTVVSHHGVAVFSGAAGTHGGLFGVVYRLREWGPTGAVVPMVAAVGLLGTRHRVLGAWTAAVWLLFAQPRFTYTVGAIAMVAAVVELAERGYADSVVTAVDSALDRGASETADRPDGGVARPAAPARVVVAALVVLSLVGLGGLGYEFAGADGTTPEFVDDDDTAAMAWAADETEPGATFVVFGDAAEWFPVYTDRTILVSPWGAEWRGPDTYEAHLDAFVNGSECANRSCAEAAMATVDADPDYVYLPNGAYTVRGDYERANGTLAASFAEHPRYERAFENDGVVVFRRLSD
ncbi:hypothetical protein [Haloarcula salinisoli]|uniref:Dolichyl-phosphate-mannose-protein mannosyltransferase n=1 Tax=Haloarcula salinisoli TaxID=2487746 RepID=A0A8J8C6E6_9EURY|nr:hypothetical protein [Halomicroarcula salinisoli]MBX0286296.1 hypothetical protein [Halomicroarcula salinisoli]MBX0302216.1 hypothetical protein [Halomicroarcula salinisoli]